MATAVPDPRATPQKHVNVKHEASSNYDGMYPNRTQSISTLLWFSRTAVLGDAKNNFVQLALYGSISLSLWEVETEALS